jgi:hypothetical protein
LKSTGRFSIELSANLTIEKLAIDMSLPAAEQGSICSFFSFLAYSHGLPAIDFDGAKLYTLPP